MRMITKIQLGTGIVILGALAVLFFPVRHSTPPADNTPAVQEAYWEGRVKTLGASRAYEEFARFVDHKDPNFQHAQAHFFGAGLYAGAGVAGLSTCDARFNFGCFHEFLGRAIAALGLSEVQNLNQGCYEALGPTFLSCQHGIGHGILAYLGYARKDLDHALSVCEDLPYNESIGGCYGGVFMEYNLQTMLGREGRIRPRAENVLYPCNELSAIYQPACVYWQPQWWAQTLRQEGEIDLARVFSTLGERCDLLKDPALGRFCFEGVGNMTAPSGDFIPSRAAALCEASSPDPLKQLFCKSTAANSLSSGGAGEVGEGEKVCDGLSGDYWSFCAAYAANKANVLTPLPNPAP